MRARYGVEDEATQGILLGSALHLCPQVAPRCVHQTRTSVSVETYPVLPDPVHYQWNIESGLRLPTGETGSKTVGQVDRIVSIL